MSYLSQAHDPRRRAAAITGTLAIHVVLGAAVVTGLTIGGYLPEKVYKPIVQFPVEDPPKPTPTPTPQSERQNSVIISPLPPIDLHPLDPPVDPVVQDEVTDDPIVIRDAGPTTRPDPPRPRPTFAPRKAAPANDPSRWITTEDYPARELRSEAEGTAAYRLIIGTNGRVSACDVTRSSGHIQLDSATCRFIERRARFEAATDETGARVIGSFTGVVKWEIPD